MASSYLHGRVHELVEQLGRDGIQGIDPIGRKRLAYFFVRGASARKFELANDDSETLRRFISYCRELIASGGGPELIADHKSGLRVDASIIRNSREPVGALILYATWLEHWVNGTIIIAAEHAGITTSRARRIVRESYFLPKFRDRLPELHLPPLSPDLLDWIAEVNALRNEYLHYK